MLHIGRSGFTLIVATGCLAMGWSTHDQRVIDAARPEGSVPALDAHPLRLTVHVLGFTYDEA